MTDLPGIAHETGRLDPGTWLCSCRACIGLAADADPSVYVVLKTGCGPRLALPAAALADCPADVLAQIHNEDPGEYVREVWVSGPLSRALVPCTCETCRASLRYGAAPVVFRAAA